MPEALIIRTATVADAPRLAELSGELGYEVTPQALVGRLTRLLRRAGDVVLVAARPTGQVVGWLHASEQELLETGRFAEIVGLIVDAGSRGLGAGRQLVERAEAWAAGRGLDALHVRSNVVRADSHPFYERIGYVRVKTQHAYRKPLAAPAAVRVAAIYDIHGNLPALEAVIEEIRQAGVDQVVVGGDVLPGPMPGETLACLLALDRPVHFIQGNGEREVLARMRGTETGAVPEPFREGMRWVADQARHEYEHLLASWPATFSVQIGGLGEVLFCHATPRSDTAIFTRATPEDRLLPVFDDVEAAVVVCGHTHMQFDRTVGQIRVVNAGSVGMPFGEPGAYWLLLGPDVQLRHTRYDLTSAAARIRATSYPQAQEFAERSVLAPPSEAATVEAFARVELK
jgi:predicted phosphodiesterase/GNAT superfamily N-acetyltransferase